MKQGHVPVIAAVGTRRRCIHPVDVTPCAYSRSTDRIARTVGRVGEHMAKARRGSSKAPTIRITWERGRQPTLRIERSRHGLEVVVDPRLSAHQVASACAQLGSEGPLIEQAWRQAVGLPQFPSVEPELAALTRAR